MNFGCAFYGLSRLLSLMTFWGKIDCLFTTSYHNSHVAEVGNYRLAAEDGQGKIGKRPAIADRSISFDSRIPTMRDGNSKFDWPSLVFTSGRTETGPQAHFEKYDSRIPHHLPPDSKARRAEREFAHQDGEMSIPVLVPLHEQAPTYATPDVPMIYVMPGVLVGQYEILQQYFDELARTFPSSTDFFHHMYPAEWFYHVDHKATVLDHPESNMLWSVPSESSLGADHDGTREWTKDSFPWGNDKGSSYDPWTGPSDHLRPEPRGPSLWSNPELMARMVKAPQFLPKHDLMQAQESISGDLKQHRSLRTAEDQDSTVSYRGALYTELKNKRTARPDVSFASIAEGRGSSGATSSTLAAHKTHTSQEQVNTEPSLADCFSETHAFLTAGGGTESQLIGNWMKNEHRTFQGLSRKENSALERQKSQSMAPNHNNCLQTDTKTEGQSASRGTRKSDYTSQPNPQGTEKEKARLSSPYHAFSTQGKVVPTSSPESRYIYNSQRSRQRYPKDVPIRKQPSPLAFHTLTETSKNLPEKISPSSLQTSDGTLEEKKTKAHSPTSKSPTEMKEPELRHPLRENENRGESSKTKPVRHLPISLQEAFGTLGEKKTKTLVTNLAFPIKMDEQERRFLHQEDGRKTVLDGQRTKLDFKMIRFLTVYFQLHDSTSHRGLKEFMHPIAYASFKKLWFTNRAQITNFEDWLKGDNNLGCLEGTRRILAFRYQIQQHTITDRWKTHTQIWLKQEGLSKPDVMAFAKRYGLSDDPTIFPELRAQPVEWDMSLRFGGSQKTVGDILNFMLGARETTKRTQMNDYLVKRVNPHAWWEKNELVRASMLYGLDLLSVLKVGDALQFGSEFFFDRGLGRLSVDSAFAHLVSVMTDTSSALSWVESSEREWLARTYGDLYQERIRALSQIIISTHAKDERGLQIYMSFVKEKIDARLIAMDSTIMGDILQWCDAGIDPDQWSTFASKCPRVTKFSHWKTLLPNEMARLSAKQESIFRAWFKWRKGLGRKRRNEVQGYYELYCQWKDWIRTGFWSILQVKMRGGKF